MRELDRIDFDGEDTPDMPLEDDIPREADTLRFGDRILPRSRDADNPLIPPARKFQRFHWDRQSREIAEHIVTAWSDAPDGAAPPLIIGGSGLGKTTIVEKLAYDMNAKHYGIDCQGATESRHILGDWVPSPEGFVYELGPLLEAMDVDPDDPNDIRVAHLDEVAALKAKFTIALYKPLHELRNNGRIVLPNGRIIQCDNSKTFVVGTTNEAREGYQGRELMDTPLIRRFDDYRGPNELSDRDSQEVLGLMWSDSPHRFQNGFSELLKSYWKFYKDLQYRVENLELAEDNAQPIVLVDREEFAKVHREFHNIYNGDIQDAMQRALRKKYFSRFRSSPKDLEEVGKMISDVHARGGLLSSHHRSEGSREPSPSAPHGNARREEPTRETTPLDSRPQRQPAAAVSSFASEGIDTGEDLFASLDRATVFAPQRPDNVEQTFLHRLEQGARGLVERDARSRVERRFGVGIEIPPLPDYVTPEVIAKLKAENISVRYLHPINFFPEAFEQMDVDEYYAFLGRQYPQFSQIERLSPEQRKDPHVPRMMEKRYWQYVKEGKLPFPNLPGQWVAVEDVPKPKPGDKYDVTSVGKDLGGRRNTRTYTRPSDMHDQVEQQKRKKTTVRRLGLPEDRVETRFPDPVEYMLLGMDEVWGKGEMYELTGAVTSDGYAIASGRASEGGVGHIRRVELHKKQGALGNRVAFFFS